jgi:hypothetical protein
MTFLCDWVRMQAQLLSKQALDGLRVVISLVPWTDCFALARFHKLVQQQSWLVFAGSSWPSPLLFFVIGCSTTALVRGHNHTNGKGTRSMQAISSSLRLL